MRTRLNPVCIYPFHHVAEIHLVCARWMRCCKFNREIILVVPQFDFLFKQQVAERIIEYSEIGKDDIYFGFHLPDVKPVPGLS